MKKMQAVLKANNNQTRLKIKRAIMAAGFLAGAYYSPQIIDPNYFNVDVVHEEMVLDAQQTLNKYEASIQHAINQAVGSDMGVEGLQDSFMEHAKSKYQADAEIEVRTRKNYIENKKVDRGVTAGIAGLLAGYMVGGCVSGLGAGIENFTNKKSRFRDEKER